MEGQPKEKEKTNGLVEAKNRGWGGPTLGKRIRNELVGAKNRGREGQPKEKEKTNG